MNKNFAQVELVNGSVEITFHQSVPIVQKEIKRMLEFWVDILFPEMRGLVYRVMDGKD